MACLAGLAILLNWPVALASIPPPPAGTLPAELRQNFIVISAEDLLSRLSRGDKIVLVDCRPREEFMAGHVPGALNISIDSLSFGKETAVKRTMTEIMEKTSQEMHFVLVDPETGEEYMPKTKLQELARILPEDRNQEVVFYCRRPECTRSPLAARWALVLGYKAVFRYEGGWQDWADKKYPVER